MTGRNWRQPLLPQKDASRRGQAMVEMALIVPVLMLLLLGTVDFGRILYAYVSITNAAREGARYAAGDPTDQAGILTRVRQEIGSDPTLDSTKVTLLSVDTPEGNYPGKPVRVRVSYNFSLISSYLVPVISNPVPLSSGASMTILRN